MQLKGVLNSKCMPGGAQGIIKTITSTNTSGQSAIITMDGPGNNTLYVFHGYSRGGFGLMPETPSSDFNFSITMENSDGFTPTSINVLFKFYVNSMSESGDALTIKWDNEAFDPSDSFTVVHIHIWFDGINYCGRVDGY